jgi:hypothetical protein
MGHSKVKHSVWCAFSFRTGQKPHHALKRSNGTRDTYCREHKRQVAREYMRRVRKQHPWYGNRNHHEGRRAERAR